MHIRWIADCWDGEAEQLESSHFASHRYRTTIPAKALRSKGHKVDITTSGQLRRAHVDLSADVLVIGKLFQNDDLHRVRETIGLFLSAASSNVKTVADINDDHFATAHVGSYWQKLCRMVDVCTVASDAMGKAVGRYATSPILTIGDPLDSPSGEPHVYRRRIFTKPPLKVAWYGMDNNINAMEKAAFAIMDGKPAVRVEFHIITRKRPDVLKLCQVFSSEFGRRGSMTFHEWTRQEQWEVVSRCDLVLIPSNPKDPAKAAKSANRLTDALNAGRYVIASPIPAYEPYGDVATITDDFPMAVAKYLANPAAAKARLNAGQAKVKLECGTDAIADQWLSAFSA